MVKASVIILSPHVLLPEADGQKNEGNSHLREKENSKKNCRCLGLLVAKLSQFLGQDFLL